MSTRPVPSTGSASRPPAHSVARPSVLANGQVGVVLGADGRSWSFRGGLALTPGGGGARLGDGGLRIFVEDDDPRGPWRLGAREGGAGPARVRRVPGGWRLDQARSGLEAGLAVAVHPDEPFELRRVTLRNGTDTPRTVRLTSFAEVALSSPEAFAAHPAFSKLFLQTGIAADAGALLVHRRPRSPGERHPWLAHALLDLPLSGWESDRARFLGRSRGRQVPAALREEALSGTVGNVLDPAVSLRAELELAPGAVACATFALGTGEDREDALKRIERIRQEVAGAWDRATEAERLRHDRLGLSAEEAERLEGWAAALLAGEIGGPPQVDDELRGDLAELIALGLSPGRPYVLASAAGLAGESEVARALALWRELGLPLDVATLADGDAARSAAERGAIVVDATAATPATRDLLRAAARLVVADDLPEPVDAAARPDPARRSATAAAPSHPPAREDPAEPLLGFNGWGGFTADGREYVIRLPRADDGAIPLPPRPWCNVVANEDFGFLVSETGAATTWSGNSREHRLTPWSNDPVLDPHEEALYLRDDETGATWSPLPGPIPGNGPYEVRHGFGTSRFAHRGAGLHHETTFFVAAEDSVRVVRLEISNPGESLRRLSVYSYSRLVLGGDGPGTARFIRTRATEDGAVLATNPMSGCFAERVAFAAAVGGGARSKELTCDRAGFLGPERSAERPRAVLDGTTLDGRTGAGLDPCAALRVHLEIPGGGTARIAFLLGDAESEPGALERIDRYGTDEAIERARSAAQDAWDERLTRIRVRTPSESLDVMLNGWLAYQTLSCRLHGRTAFYQSGGAFGFRDQLQDAVSLLALDPGLARRQILLHARHQFVEGDVLHWWHPPDSRGIRTRFADDLLWLPWATAQYVEATGDTALLDEELPFLDARALAPGEDEAFVFPVSSGQSASLYEHCVRTLDRSLALGAHGLPLFGTGDWNDGMNRVGREGRGESVWMAFFQYDILGRFLPLCRARGDETRAAGYEEHRGRVRDAANDAGWDGEWYRRGYYDDGTPLGTSTGDECRIDVLAQAWAVLSGAAPPDRGERAMRAAAEHLVSEREGLIRLLTPPFENTPHDPGYIKGYVPGVRENGGQYTHAALWTVAAAARLRWRDRAARWLDLLNPVLHAVTPADVERYGVEPYVVAADVYGADPHVGRGGWTWYTGSSGWMFRVALESILGVRWSGGDTLDLDPCVPDDWPGFEIELRAPDGARISITATNPDRCTEGVVSARLDGKPLPPEGRACRVRLPRDGAPHAIELVLGAVVADSRGAR